MTHQSLTYARAVWMERRFDAINRAIELLKHAALVFKNTPDDDDAEYGRECDLVASLLKERNLLSAPVVPDGWQPIETAPRDGKVDLWWCNRRYIECYRDPLDRGWRTTSPNGQLVLITNPTHWMPVPADPDKREGGCVMG